MRFWFNAKDWELVPDTFIILLERQNSEIGLF